MSHDPPRSENKIPKESTSLSSSPGTAQPSNLESHIRATTSSFTMDASKQANQSYHQILKCQLRKRRLWERFNLKLNNIRSARWDDWNAYEVHNGYLGYYLEENERHKIIFNCLDSNGIGKSGDATGSVVGSSERTEIDASVEYERDGIAVEETMPPTEISRRFGYDVSRTTEVTLPACPMAFTFDISQDLLVILEEPEQDQ
jgi:hypothetical protein